MRTKAPNHQRSVVFSEAMFLAASGLPGDFNGDSAVDRADYDVLHVDDDYDNANTCGILVT